MNQLSQSMLIWGCTLIFGFPLITIIIGQLGDSLRRREHPLTLFVEKLQKFVLPPLTIFLIVRNVLGIEDGGIPVQFLETILGIAVIHTSLCLIQSIFTAGKPEYKWQIAVPNLLYQVIRAAMVLCTIAYVLSDVWNVDLTQAAQALGVGSLVIALALQDTLSNLVSGFLLLADSPFKKGDWIQVGNLKGKVVDINWRAVRLLTFDDDLLIVPNGSLGKQNILNYSQPTSKSGTYFLVSFSRNDPPTLVKKIVQEVYQQVPNTVGPVTVGISDFNDFAISYIVWYYASGFFPKFSTARDFKGRLYYAAKRSGLTMPYPVEYQYSTDITQVDAQKELLTNQRKLADYLKSLPYFSAVSPEQISMLIPDTTLEYYGIGEEVIREGELVQGFYIIQHGNAQLTIKDNQGKQQEITKISNDNFFGESVFMSGKQSAVSVNALTDMELIKIGADAASNLILESPRFAKQIEEALEERQAIVERIFKQINGLTQELTDNGNLASSSVLRQLR